VKGSLRINMFVTSVMSTWTSMRDTVFLTRHRSDDKWVVIRMLTDEEAV
jgi:hypothetical protein